MDIAEKVRKVARDITIAYAHHIKDRINSEDEDYIEIGVDDDFVLYEALFKSVLIKALGASADEVRLFPNVVVLESINVIESLIISKGYEGFLSNKVICESVFEVCMFILEKVKKDEFDDSELGVK